MAFVHKHIARREFLRQACSITALAGSPFAVNLATIGAASAQTAPSYRALVCLYMNGGNDQSNTVVPIGNAEYAAYRAGRTASLALAQNAVLPIAPTAWSGPQLGLHPALSAMKPLFDQGRCAILANVGMLSQPITRQQWNNGSPTVAVPAMLESHSDQTTQWQTAIPNGGSPTGWLGRAADLLRSTSNGDLSLCISAAGNNLLQAGSSTIPYAITTRGAVHINALDSLGSSTIAGQALRKLMTEPRTQLLERQLNTTAVRSIDAEAQVNAAIQPVSLQTMFPETGLGAQLRIVARLIGARVALGHRRQIFYVSLGGFDFHDNLLDGQANLLKQVSDALAAFYKATVELGVAESVTAFTASEFGRALQANNDGSDHGWGSHHFIIGGAVRGNRVYGTWPTVALNSNDDARRGILIPTTSVHEYAATLASWMGVSASDLSAVVPNVGRFARPNLGFLA